MKTSTFSVVVGDDKCNANCPFCVSKMTGNASEIGFNRGRLAKACKIAKSAADGLLTTMLTGKGEPMLYPGQIGEILKVLDQQAMPLVELQTNGTLIDHWRYVMDNWKGVGLDLVCISIASPYPDISNEVMGIKGDYNYWDAVKILQEIGFSVRLNCTMTKQGLHTVKEFQDLMTKCWHAKVDQVTLREVDRPACCGPQATWVDENKPVGFAKKLSHCIEMRGGTRLLELTHGGVVYDLNGQNVCVSNCLTGSTNPDDTRQIIFFPDGRIAYDWRYEGARIL